VRDLRDYDFTAGHEMLDHHAQVRFTLVWAPVAERQAMCEIVVRGVYATFRGQ